MSAHAYTEEQLVEQPAIQLFKELGWSTVSALEEIFGSAEPSPVPSGHPLPVGEGRGEGRVALLRETKGEVVLVSRLRAALERLNPALPPEAITAAVDELTRDRSAMGLPAANREIYTLIKDGIRVSIGQPEDSPSSPALLPSVAPSPWPLPRGEEMGEGSSAVPSTSGRGTG
jgi:type I restriction enzyme R subunit